MRRSIRQPTEVERVGALIRAYSLTPAHVAAALGWPIEKTEKLLGLRTGRPHVSIGPRRVDRLTAACSLAPVVGATPADLARAGESDEARSLVEFAAACCDRGIKWRVGDRAPRSTWPETKTHRIERYREYYRNLGFGLASYSRPGNRSFSSVSARDWEDLGEEIASKTTPRSKNAFVRNCEDSRDSDEAN